MTVGAVTDDKVLKQAQENVWMLFRNDATLTSYTTNILDGIPQGLTKGIGFPYIIVPTPNIEPEEPLTFSAKQDTLVFYVQIFDKKESNVRLIADRIRKLCDDNEQYFNNTYGMFDFLNPSASLDYVTTEDNSVIYQYTLKLKWEWIHW